MMRRHHENPSTSTYAEHPDVRDGRRRGEYPGHPGPVRREILRSGLPGVRDLPTVTREAQFDAYLEQTVRHDLTDGRTRRIRILTDWPRAHAAGASTTTAYDSTTTSAASTRSISSSRTATAASSPSRSRPPLRRAGTEQRPASPEARGRRAPSSRRDPRPNRLDAAPSHCCSVG